MCTSVYAVSMKATRTLATALLALTLSASAPAMASAPVESDNAIQLVSVTGGMQEPVVFASWVQLTLADTGMELPKGLTVKLTNERNCGAESSPVGLGGCTRHLPEGPEILVSPELAGTVAGYHILLHELGHAEGIVNECGAEYFAHEWSAEGYWAYPECAR